MRRPIDKMKGTPMRALLCLDLINDIVHPDGKLAGKGYVDFAAKHDSLQRIARIQDQFRQLGYPVIHFRVGFGKNYPELNESSPILGGAKKAGALQLGTWGTDLHADVSAKEGEPTIAKHRVSPFHRTRLEIILRTQKIDELFICGVATNIAVESAVRDAHDYDFNPTVISDACIAADDATHEAALTSMKTFAKVLKFSEIAPKLTS